MDVELYVYDLSKGLARQLSLQITGTFIEAIYHTAIVVGGIEYFYGHGIYRKIPGSTHHGRPMEIIPLGKTELPSEVIEEYVQSLEPIYTPESYDLFNNNCNNFSQDLSVFLVGKNIPSKIRDLPRTFLATPMGQMMRGMVDNSLRSMTQAPDAVSGQSVRPQSSPSGSTNGHQNGVVPSSRRLHPHNQMKLPGLQYKIQQAVTYKKIPPLEKLIPKLGPMEKDSTVLQLVEYIKARESKGMHAVPLPNVLNLDAFLLKAAESLPGDASFPFVDLLRICAIDPRLSSLLATHSAQLLTFMPAAKDYSTAAYSLQVVTLQLACNLFSSNVFQEQTIKNRSIRDAVANLVSGCLLSTRHVVRSLSAVLLYNFMAFDHNERMENRPDQGNVSALPGVEEALVEAVVSETENKDTFHALLLSLGMVLYSASYEASIWELCDAMEVKNALDQKSKIKVFADEPLLNEVTTLLSAKRTG